MPSEPPTAANGIAEVELASPLGAPVPCLNCGAVVAHQYCPECGQARTDPDPTLRELLHELAADFLNWDGKLLGTLRQLVTAPGSLTVEYLAGRRARFISPLRVYLTCSVLFFFVKALLPDAPLNIRATTVGRATSAKATATRIGVITVQESDEAESLRELDKLAASSDGLSRLWGRHFASALRNKAALSASVTTNIPRMMFVLVPIYAALVALVFRRRRMRYPKHLAFALHVHAFLFLALMLTLAPRIVKAGWVNAVLVLTSVCLVAAHLVLATRGVYAVSTGGAIGRSALIAAAYFVVFVLASVALFGLVVFFKF
ncbi:MAG: DUF3667 domain-containing protein [bacterium]